jgi:hypothetical protein
MLHIGPFDSAPLPSMSEPCANRHSGCQAAAAMKDKLFAMHWCQYAECQPPGQQVLGSRPGVGAAMLDLTHYECYGALQLGGWTV